MPLVNEKQSFVGYQELKFKNAQNNEGFNQSFQSQANFTQTNEAKGLISLPPALMQIVPWIPFALEALTGQKMPMMGGTMGEIQSSLQQLQFQLNQVLTQQQQIWSKLEGLENHASQQLTNLSQQIANANKDFKLLATETKRSLEFSQNHRLNELERNPE